MKRKTIFLTIGVVLVLLAGVFWAGRASASVGCFTDTNGNWAEVYICWLKDNGISNGFGDGTYHPSENVTREQMAKFLRLQAEVPPSTGLIVYNIGLSDWYVGGSYSDPRLFKYNYYLSFGRNGTGFQRLDTSPSIPIALYGRDLAIVGFHVCYAVDTTHGNVESINFTVYSMDPSGVGVPTTEASASINGPLTNAACVWSNLPASVVMDIHTRILIYIFTENTVAGEVVRIGRASLIFQPTTTLHVP